MATQTKTRPREGPRSKRGLIIEAAVDRFGQDGFDNTKWAAIADEVGIGQTALYHYFESKAHCLLTIMSLELERSLDRFKDATAEVEDDAERLRAAVSSAFHVTQREALAARILLSHMDLLATPRPSEREEVERRRARALVRAIEEEWAALIEEGIAGGAFAPRDSRQSSRAVLALIVGVWRWYRPGGDHSLAEIADFVSGACWRVVRP
jgi:AcrR family transcriptional regulator